MVESAELGALGRGADRRVVGTAEEGTMSIDHMLHLVALVLFIVAAIGVPKSTQLIAGGLACWVATFLV